MNATHPLIVVLDGYTNNPGDLSWDHFRALGELHLYDHSTADQVVQRCRNAAVVCTNKTPLGEAQLAALPALRYIGVLATGVNVVDLAAARVRGVTVTNTPGYGTDSVAQHTIGLMLACACHIPALDHSVRQGEWQRRGVFSYWHQAPVELAGKQLGLIGLGAIGRRVAAMGLALGMKVMAYTPRGRPWEGVAAVSLPELRARADVISLHCPLTAANSGLIDGAFIDGMKPGAILINTARGGLLNEADVAQALARGRLGGLGIDVLDSEPPAPDNPLLAAPRCVITPHSAWASVEARRRLLEIAAANIQAWLAGRPANTVA